MVTTNLFGHGLLIMAYLNGAMTYLYGTMTYLNGAMTFLNIAMTYLIVLQLIVYTHL